LPPGSDPASRAHRDHLVRIADAADTVALDRLDDRMRAVVIAQQRIDADIGSLLCGIADRGLHHELGYRDFGAYCRNALGICTRKARALLAIERKARRTCSRLTEAYRHGLVSWHRCLVLLPVLTEQTAAAWIERAQRVTARGLADEVLWARMACDAGVLPEPAPPPLGVKLENNTGQFVQIRGSLAGAESAEATSALSPVVADERGRPGRAQDDAWVRSTGCGDPIPGSRHDCRLVSRGNLRPACARRTGVGGFAATPRRRPLLLDGGAQAS
jgi:hypothetical protein